MSKKDKLTKKQKGKLQKLIDEIMKLSSEVVEDYKKNPSELSGSITQVHEDSPFLATKEERLLKIKKNDSE